MAEIMKTDACLVSKGNGRDGSDRFRLQTKRDVLVKSMGITDINELLDRLSAKAIFNTEERNRVTYERVPEDKTRTLLDILETKVDVTGRDPPVLDIFVDYLRKNVGEDLAKELIEADGMKLAGGPEEAIKLAEGMELTEKILSGVIRQIGPKWTSVALDLDVSSLQIERIKYSMSDPYEQAFTVFNAWRQKCGFQPGGFIVLLKALRDHSDQCSVEWPKICDFLKAKKQ